MKQEDAKVGMKVKCTAIIEDSEYVLNQIGTIKSINSYGNRKVIVDFGISKSEWHIDERAITPLDPAELKKLEQLEAEKNKCSQQKGEIASLTIDTPPVIEPKLYIDSIKLVKEGSQPQLHIEGRARCINGNKDTKVKRCTIRVCLDSCLKYE